MHLDWVKFRGKFFLKYWISEVIIHTNAFYHSLSTSKSVMSVMMPRFNFNKLLRSSKSDNKRFLLYYTLLLTKRCFMSSFHKLCSAETFVNALVSRCVELPCSKSEQLSNSAIDTHIPCRRPRFFRYRKWYIQYTEQKPWP